MLGWEEGCYCYFSLNKAYIMNKGVIGMGLASNNVDGPGVTDADGGH